MAKSNSKTLLTLIEGATISPPLGTKILKRETTLSLIEGQDLIERVKKERDVFKIDAAKEVESIREKAVFEGFQEGLGQWLSKIHELEEEIQKVRQQVQKQIVPVAIKAAQKVVAKELEVHPETIIEIVKSHLKAVAQHKKIILYVSREEFDLLDKTRDRLKEKLEALETFSIRMRDDLKKGGIVIETEGGIINATIENQWAKIEQAFKLSER